MEDDDQNYSESENFDSDVSEIDGPFPSAVRIFSLFREALPPNHDDNSTDGESTDSDEQLMEPSAFPDDNTRTLPCEHKYLGELEQIRGRIIMDDDSIQKIPLLIPSNPVMLVPGQTVPLIENQESGINVLKYAVESDHIFGIISSAFWDPNKKVSNAVGTTAEIYEYAQTENGFIIKAKGRQRFKILKVTSELMNDSYIRFAFIKIQPEVRLNSVLDGVQLPSLNKFRTSQRFKCMRRESCQTRWPAWTYRNYDEKYLVDRVKKKVAEHCKFKNLVLPDDPTSLSFQLLKIVPIPQKMVLEALQLNSPIQRLRWLLFILDSQTSKLLCVTCKTSVGYHSDIFSMSAEGPHGTYVNSFGYVHELITLKKVKNTYAQGPPETQYSWFPGYAWSILSCKSCQYHLGWKFTACSDNLTPSEFWGIKNSSVTVKNDKNMETSAPTRTFRYRFRGPRFH
ncbi:protein cereblon [Planococcus citri]|uniref:protein cereblon n=1 Tax=Planococcus citri TaxID=170843 RepID=UPI0031F755B0